jgi:murein DD-endopeptidase MepM/ murein hydrolase activator NlpD
MRFPVDAYVASFLKVPMAQYGAHRKHNRKHAGCDIYVPEGTPVKAIADGRIRQDLTSFYEGTASITVEHDLGVVRYGELSFEPPTRSGVYSNPRDGFVKEGRVLGYVKTTRYPVPMLHFEFYAGNAEGPLTVRKNKPFERRSDLVDATDLLTLLLNQHPEAKCSIGFRWPWDNK